MSTSCDFKMIVERYLAKHGHERFAPKAALIDMDGTLYDSMGNHANAWHRMTTELGLNCTRDEFFLYEGMTGASTLNLIFNRELGRGATAEEIERLYHLKTIYFSEQPPVERMKGASDMLAFLSDRGLRRVLVTGSGQSSLINRLNEDFPGAFHEGDRITSRDVKHGKPHPEPYLMAMKIADVEPFESIVFENAPLGVQAGSASGAFTIGLTTGPIPADALANAGADVIFPSMEACAKALPILFDEISTH